MFLNFFHQLHHLKNYSYKSRLQNNIRLFQFASFFAGLIFVVPIWVNFEKQFFNFQQMAALEVIAMSSTLLLELPSGALADLIGRRPTIFLGRLFRFTGNLISAFAFNALVFTIGFVIASIGTAFVSGADDALVYDSLKELGREKEYQKISSKNSLMFQIALTFATLMGGYLYHFYYRLPYILFALAELATAWIFFKTIEPKLDSEKFTLKSYLKQTKKGFLELFKNKYVAKLSCFYFLVGGVTWTSQYFLNQVYADDLGFTFVEKGWLFAIIRLIVSIGLFRMLNFTSVVTKKRAFMVFPILLILSYTPAFWANKWLGIFLLSGATLGSTARFTILGQYTNDEFSSRNRATAISTLNMLVSLVYIIFLSFGGGIIESHSSKILYGILGIVSLLVILPLGIVLAKHEHHD